MPQKTPSTIAALPGLGPASTKQLNQVGITCVDQLRQLGSIVAYARLQRAGISNLNFLYALEGALTNRPWQQVAKQDKGRLLLELEGYKALEALK